MSVRLVRYKIPSDITPGQLQWVGAIDDPSVANSVKTDRFGNAIIVGTFTGTINFGDGRGDITSSGGTDMFMAKYSSAGVLSWAKNFGGIGDDAPLSVTTDSDDNIIMTGRFKNTVDFTGDGSGIAGTTKLTSGGDTDIFVAKYSPAGALLWVKAFGGAVGEIGQSVATDASDNIFLIASISPPATFGAVAVPTGCMALVKFDSSGVVLNAKGYGDPGNGFCNTTPNMVAIDSNGDVLVAGEFLLDTDFGGGRITAVRPYFNVFIAKYLGSNLNYVWAKNTGSGTGNCRGFGATSYSIPGFANNVILSGIIQGEVNLGGGNFTPTGSTTLFMSAYRSSGEFLWKKTFDNVDQGSNTTKAIASADGNIIGLTGQFTGAIDTGIGWLTSSTAGTFLSTLLISDVSTTPPTTRWNRPARGSGQANGNGVTFDASGHVLYTGFFQLSKDFGDGHPITGSPQGSYFVAQYAK